MDAEVASLKAQIGALNIMMIRLFGRLGVQAGVRGNTILEQERAEMLKAVNILLKPEERLIAEMFINRTFDCMRVDTSAVKAK